MSMLQSMDKTVLATSTLVALAVAPYIGRIVRTIFGRLYISQWLLPRSIRTSNNTDDTDEEKQVSGLFIHPVKSLRPIEIDAATLDAKGFVDDRRFMLITPMALPIYKDSFDKDEPTHRFLTQRQCPCLATVVAKFSKDGKTLVFSSHRLPGETVRVSTELKEHAKEYLTKLWDDVVQVGDLGDEASRFFQRLLETDADELPPEYQNMDVRFVKQLVQDGRCTDGNYTPPSTRTLSIANKSPPVALTDGFPILIATEASLEELNKRLAAKGKDPVPMAQFRPNIVVKGGKAFEEDGWKVISIDGVIFHTVKVCSRCKQSCTDQINGSVSDEPLATMSEFRALAPNKEDVYFAQNAIAASGMEGRTISKGAIVKVLERGEPVWG